MNRFLLLSVMLLLANAALAAISAQTPDADGGETASSLSQQQLPLPHEVLAASDLQTASISDRSHGYRAYTKRTLIVDAFGVYPPAEIVSFSYEHRGALADPMRPVMFFFNGGPGSSSIWLHMTGFGPEKVSADLVNAEDGNVSLTQDPNEGFLIDVADLVFVDSVGTGLSRVIEGGNETAFKDLRVDARAMCRFVENWLKGEDRVGAPVYIVGVSYSSLRAAGMASHPNCRDFRDNLHGLILVSGLLDLRMRHPFDLDGPVSRYPTIAAVAWQRGLVDRSAWDDDLDQFLNAMETYADTVIATALAQEQRLEAAAIRAIMDELNTQLGLPSPSSDTNSIAGAIRHAQARVDGNRIACGYDARFDCGRGTGSHPDLPLTSFGRELEGRLIDQIESSMDYEIEPQDYNVIRGNRFRANWDYRFQKSFESGAGTDMSRILLRQINLNDPTRIMVVSGIYDLVTPYYAVELALRRAGLPPEQCNLHLYEGGHMMYLEKETGYQLAADIRSFVRKADRPS
ncbi:MAG: hypothetical protein HRT81_06145 [Henriciella sp.]|nr:hypothetical protein [Henriciella sp.]